MLVKLGKCRLAAAKATCLCRCGINAYHSGFLQRFSAGSFLRPQNKTCLCKCRQEVELHSPQMSRSGVPKASLANTACLLVKSKMAIANSPSKTSFGLIALESKCISNCSSVKVPVEMTNRAKCRLAGWLHRPKIHRAIFTGHFTSTV